ncbi:MAG TPA: cytochrome ubiquinol oxidase subunit I, partial [Bacteroidetes bacterium]|nr:cytochrome ubiquinol oxidase subunit I [Bacteroidota bacterium]
TSTGWIFTEIARQPWVVFGLFKTADGVSKAAGVFEVFLSLVLFTLLYAALIVADVYLLKKYAVAGTEVVLEEN